MDHKPLSESMIAREARRLYCNLTKTYDVELPVELDNQLYLKVGDQCKQLCSTHLMLSLDEFADQILRPMIMLVPRKVQVDNEQSNGGGKMTRQEAYDKTRGSLGKEIVDALEVLGLLKFEEEKKYIELLNAVRDGLMNSAGTKEFIDKLEKRGYKIVKVS